MEFTLKLPYPPSNNHYKRKNKNFGKISKRTGKKIKLFVLEPETDRYHREVWFRFRIQGGKKLLSKTIRMEVLVYPPDRRKRDLDNVLKVLMDSLQKAEAYEDDFYIQELMLVRKEIIIGGELIVKLMEI